MFGCTNNTAVSLPNHPHRQALDLGFAQQPAEVALLGLLPAPNQQATAGASKRPSLADMHYEQERVRSAEGSQAAATKAAGSAAGGAAATSSGNGGSAAQQQGSDSQSGAAELANEIQFTLQQAEEAALRERRAAEERAEEEREEAERQRQQLGQRRQAAQHAAAGRGGKDAPGQAAGDGGEATSYDELSIGQLQRGVERRPHGLGLQQLGAAAAAGGAATAPTGSGVRMLLGVVSACCTEKAAARRAVLRDTWARTIREVRVGMAVCGGRARAACRVRKYLPNFSPRAAQPLACF